MLFSASSFFLLLIRFVLCSCSCTQDQRLGVEQYQLPCGVHRNLFWQLSRDRKLHGSGMSHATTGSLSKRWTFLHASLGFPLDSGKSPGHCIHRSLQRWMSSLLHASQSEFPIWLRQVPETLYRQGLQRWMSNLATCQSRFLIWLRQAPETLYS